MGPREFAGAFAHAEAGAAIRGLRGCGVRFPVFSPLYYLSPRPRARDPVPPGRRRRCVPFFGS